MQAGDRVAIYMPMIPETVIAMLACARIGAAAHVVFGGFSAEALADRIHDCDARVVITADGGYRRGAAGALKPAVDEASSAAPTSATCSSSSAPARTSTGTTAATCGGTTSSSGRRPSTTPEAFDAEHPLYIMYTSGHDGEAQGHPAHDRRLPDPGAPYTHWAIFDLKPETTSTGRAADIGWVTGHSYIVYGPLANGVTSVMYEGTPDTPHQGRWWEIIEKYGVTILYTAPRRSAHS